MSEPRSRHVLAWVAIAAPCLPAGVAARVALGLLAAAVIGFAGLANRAVVVLIYGWVVLMARGMMTEGKRGGPEP